MLDTMAIKFTMGFECGKKEKHFHFQIMMDIHIKDVDVDHFNAFKMFVKAALPELDGVQIRIKTAESDGQTHGGCFGYPFKDWGKPHFLKDSKGFSEQECLTMFQEHQQFATSYTVLQLFYVSKCDFFTHVFVHAGREGDSVQEQIH